MGYKRIGLLPLTCALLVGCTQDPSPEHSPGTDPHPVLKFPGEDMGVSGTFSDITEGEPFTFTTLPVCIDGEGTIEVTSVTPVDDRNISIERFAVVEYGGLSSAADVGSFEDIGVDPSRRVVTRACGGMPADISVELFRTGAETGWIDAFDVHYEAGDEDLWATVPVRVVLCSPDDTTTQYC